MTTLLTDIVRHAFREERIPARIRWWFAAQGMCDWYDALRHGLSDSLGGDAACAHTLSEIAQPMFARRYARLRESHAGLPDPTAEPRSVALLTDGLMRLASRPESGWILSHLGGPASGFREHVMLESLLATLSMRERWEEVTCHLGEYLIALTQALPSHGVERARAVLGEICFRAGEHAARKIRKAFGMKNDADDALEVLRMSEYVFRVNPQHWSAVEPDAQHAYLEGTACPWYTADGWNAGHCGIFGQFQSGIASTFGLRYQLTQTIPKHGGHTCRIDLRPLPLRFHRDAKPVVAESSLRP